MVRGVTVRVRGYHLPGIEDQVAADCHRCGEVDVELPRLTPAQLRTAIDRAKEVVMRRVRARSVDDILQTIDRIVANWMRPDYHLRQLAERALPSATGFSAAMIRHGLPLLVAPLRAEAIRALLTVELGDHHVLAGVRSGRRAVGPLLITHVLPGNIPGLAALPMALSLAVKSALVVKSAAGDPIFPALFAASISEVDDDLGQCILVTHWRGGDGVIEEVAFGQAELVVAAGSDAAMAAIAGRVTARFIGHGHKISFAAIGKERLSSRDAARECARRLAYDVSLWDQQGCLSPQLCYIEMGGQVTPGQFGELLAEVLAEHTHQLPPRRLSFEDQAAVLRFRQEAEWRQNQSITLLASADSTDWSVSIERDADFVPSCLNRCLRLKVVADLFDLQPVLAPHRRHLEAVGVAVDTTRVSALTEMLAACGVHRVCPLGAMQRPPLSWPQSGRPRLADWVEWTEVEEGAK